MRLGGGPAMLAALDDVICAAGTTQHRRFEVITTERELKSEVESAGHAYRKVVKADKVNYYADDKWLGSRFVGGHRDRLIEALNRAASRI